MIWGFFIRVPWWIVLWYLVLWLIFAVAVIVVGMGVFAVLLALSLLLDLTAWLRKRPGLHDTAGVVRDFAADMMQWLIGPPLSQKEQ